MGRIGSYYSFEFGIKIEILTKSESQIYQHTCTILYNTEIESSLIFSFQLP